ncbi:MAG: EamA family transporter [Gammaproteobacteria bacterium]|nr:EamA family transporter [Gammaproteobacteria bacterium]
MVSVHWWVYSIAAAIVWGVHFNLVAKIMKMLPKDLNTPITLFMITALPIFLVLPFNYHKVFGNLMTLWQAKTEIRISVIILIFTTIIAANLLYVAMQLSPNPTIASLIDITYPLFIAIIAWLVYRENHIDWSVLLGGALILSGSMLIVWKHG